MLCKSRDGKSDNSTGTNQMRARPGRLMDVVGLIPSGGGRML